MKDGFEQEVLRLYAELSSAPEVGRLLGVGSTLIYRVLTAHSVERTIKGPRAKSRTWNDAQTEEIRKRYLEGESCVALAREFGGHPATVRNTLRRLGLELRSKGPIPNAATSDQKQEVIQLYLSRMPMEAIQARLGLSRAVVRSILRDNKLAPLRASGPNHGCWAGGRTVVHGGYVRVLIKGDDPFFLMADHTSYVLEHRLVMARHLGRLLSPHETVHHINGDRQDNRIENLQLRQGKHGSGIVMACLECGSHNIGPVPLK